nr:MAG: hypothetical protein [Bacteriophage sp.]
MLTFELPEAITISALYITFQQNRQTVLEKDLTAVTYDKENGIITLPLSQEDTLLFSELEPVWVQLRLRDNVAWNGTTWDVLAGTMDLSAYMLAEDLVAISNAELDNICK